MCWLLHWGVFVFLYTAPVSLEGKNYFTDFLLQNIHIIQNHAPHLLRYVVVSSALSRSRRKDIIRIIQQVTICFRCLWHHTFINDNNLY